MLILGNKYKITKEEKILLSKKVKSLHKIDIKNNSDEKIIGKLKSYIKGYDIEFIVLNLDKDLSLQIKSYLEELDYDGIKIMLFSEFTSKLLYRYHIDFNEKNFEVYQNIHHNEFENSLKRIFDVLFSTFALMFLSPVFLIVAVLIKIKSPNGPIFFGHQRIGKDGNFFRVYKFRTMVPDAQEKLKKLLQENEEARKEFEKDFKLKNDPRIISSIGNFMRKASIDELPQFFNVFLGNMSVVGPRPIVEDEVKKYGKYAIKLYSVKPGVTGLWQVSGRNDISYDERVSLDMEYVDNNSLIKDIKIIFKTVMVLKKGAY